MVRHGIRLLSLWDAAPAQVLAKVNTAMLAQQETDRFVTAVAAHLSWQEQGLAVELASAGHPAAAVVRAGGAVSFSSGGGLPLGLFEDGGTRTEQLLLQPGDTLVLTPTGSPNGTRPTVRCTGRPGWRMCSPGAWARPPPSWSGPSRTI
jgi:phosphoserine phosphatase RsbU/P